MQLKVIARVCSDFPTKYGVPRQSGLVRTRATVVFEPEFRNPDALRGLDAYSHLWLIWGFTLSARDGWSPTVRPPRLGGNARMGVFATRSPFRPNALGLSCVEIEAVSPDPRLGTVIRILGADLVDGTPVYDIKPYLSFADAHPEARNGFAEAVRGRALRVHWECACPVDGARRAEIEGILGQDPRPAYQDDPRRVYGFAYAGHEVRFRVDGDDAYIVEISPA